MKLKNVLHDFSDIFISLEGIRKAKDIGLVKARHSFSLPSPPRFRGNSSKHIFFRNRRQRGRAVRALGPLIGPTLTRLWLNLFSVAWPRVFKRWIALSTGYIKIYPLDNAIGFPNTYPRDSDLSGW